MRRLCPMHNALQKSAHGRSSALVFSLLLACTLLLNACSLGGQSNPPQATGNTPAPVPSPTVSPSLQQQGMAQLQTFQQWISLMQQYGGNVSNYQQQYSGDQQALNAATSDSAYQTALTTLNGHVTAIKLPALKTEAQSLQQKLAQEASAWSSKHTYYDSYDGVTYQLGYEYEGVVNYPAQYLLDSSTTLADHQYIVGQLNVWLASFQAYKTNFSDKTPYDQ